MRDQKGSKMFDQVAFLLGEIIEQEFAKPDDVGSPDEEHLFTFNDALNTLKAFLLRLAEDPSGNCTSCYASHCAQSLLSLVSLAIAIERRKVATRSPPADSGFSNASKNDEQDHTVSNMEETFLYFLITLR